MKIITFLILSLFVFTNETKGKSATPSAFFPKSSNSSSMTFKTQGPVTKSDYLKMQADFKKIYAIEIQEHNIVLDFPNLWDDLEINAYAHRSKGEKIFSIEIMGGIARHPLMTKDALALVICHELGHHFGGAPKKSPIEITKPERPGKNDRLKLFGIGKPKKPKSIPNWSSAEGQADYYASTKCMKRYLAFSEENGSVYNISDKNQDDFVLKNCHDIYKNEKEISYCFYTAYAGLQTAKIFQSLKSNVPNPKFETPAKEIVKSTIEGYPSVQCRLDSFFQGSLCDVDPMISPSHTDAKIGYCVSSEKPVGARPKCWFKE